jgi:hypothetical protein
MSNSISETTPRGRPALWAGKEERQRQHRARQAEKLRLLTDLLHAARQANWANPELHRIAQHGDDAELLRALTGHYRQRHWCSVQATETQEGGQ